MFILSVRVFWIIYMGFRAIHMCKCYCASDLYIESHNCVTF
jgi:hypothetical protein